MVALYQLLLLFSVSVYAAQASRVLLQAGEGIQSGPASPPFDVVNKTDGYELRKYDNATWAISFAASRWSVDLAAVRAGWGLAAYFKGANENHTCLGISIPVVGTVIGPPPPHPPPHGENGSHPGPGPPHGNHTHHHHHPHGPPAVVLAAYIPKKFQDDTPKPLDKHVKIFHTNATDVYVRSFGGWALSWVVLKQIHRLAEALKADGICPRSGKFFIATYDPPLKLTGRHNEVWWVKRPKHSHHNDSSAQETFQLQFEELLAPAHSFTAIGPEAFPELSPSIEDQSMPEPPPLALEDVDGCDDGEFDERLDGYSDVAFGDDSIGEANEAPDEMLDFLSSQSLQTRLVMKRLETSWAGL
jgi:hypothetical protein